jgi:chromosome partitioning protein
MIITVASLKGGTGKSTLASCLAVHWQLQSKKAVIIDADPQRSVARLAARERALAGVRVIEDASDQAFLTARKMAEQAECIIIDTPGFRASITLACTRSPDLVLVPVKASPLDIDRMLDTVDTLLPEAVGQHVAYRCVLTQTSRASAIARHIRQELSEAGFPLLRTELTSRVAYPEAALFGATPSMLAKTGAAALEIAALAREIDELCGLKLAA